MFYRQIGTTSGICTSFLRSSEQPPSFQSSEYKQLKCDLQISLISLGNMLQLWLITCINWWGVILNSTWKVVKLTVNFCPVQVLCSQVKNPCQRRASPGPEHPSPPLSLLSSGLWKEGQLPWEGPSWACQLLFSFQLCQSFSVWPRSNHLPNLNFSILICEKKWMD